MNIRKNIVKYLFTAVIFISGTISFANTLSAVDVLPDANGGRIILNTSDNTVVKKYVVSDNEIKLKLSNTEISQNLTFRNSDLDKNAKFHVVQDGTSTILTIKDENVVDFQILNGSEESIIPVSSNNNIALYISALLFILSLCFMSKKAKTYSSNSNVKKIKTSVETKTAAEKDMLRDLQTLRTRNHVANNLSIHGNPVLRFSGNSINSNMSVPEGLKSAIPFERKISYLKTAVNS